MSKKQQQKQDCGDCFFFVFLLNKKNGRTENLKRKNLFVSCVDQLVDLVLSSMFC